MQFQISLVLEYLQQFFLNLIVNMSSVLYSWVRSYVQQRHQNLKTHVADPLIPILLSIELVKTPFLGPKDPSSLT